jgi:protein TonB
MLLTKLPRPAWHRQREDQMFNNLIESSSHTREFKRRGSFLLLTTAVYALLLAIAGVGSIYAYDAHLNEEATDLELISYVPLEPTKPVGEQPHRTKGDNSTKNSAKITQAVRPVLIDNVNPNNVPKNTSAVASLIPPAPRDAVIGPRILDPSNSGPITNTSGPGGTEPGVVHDIGPAPPAATLPSKKILYISRVLNGQATYLPKPIYSELAKRVRASGTVVVQVLIDEFGNVVSAQAVSGHPVLMPEAVRAARQARFSATKLNDQPVKVSGTITYNFVLRQ